MKLSDKYILTDDYGRHLSFLGMVECPECLTRFIKKHHRQKFCCSRCGQNYSEREQRQKKIIKKYENKKRKKL